MDMFGRTIVIFTGKTPEMLFDLGGTGWWVAAERELKRVDYAIICHNAHDPRFPGDASKHGDAILIGRVAGFETREDGRKLIKFSKFSDFSIKGFWPGNRNPVYYMEGRDVHDAFDGVSHSLNWKLMPKPKPEIDRTSAPSSSSLSDVLSFHREAIAEELGIQASQVSISING